MASKRRNMFQKNKTQETTENATDGAQRQGQQKSGGSKHLRYRLDYVGRTITDVLRDRGWYQVEGESDAWDLFWCELGQLKHTLEGRRLANNQRVPHFRNYYELTKKDHLWRNVQRLKKTYLKEGRLEEARLCDCIPTTFELPSEYLMFVEHYRKHPGSIWIVKPATGSQGRGIFLFRKLKDLNDWRNSRDWTSKDQQRSSHVDGDNNKDLPPDNWVIQKYIGTPYLIAGRKFDLRIYVLVTSFMPLKVWVARDGFARLSGSQFNLNEIKDNSVHLTNMSIQLHSETANPGCKWSLRQLREFLTARHGLKAVEKLIQQIGEVIMTSLKSVQKIIMHNKHCFELYGYDILLEEDLTPWLLEVNASPSLGATDADDYNLKYNLLTDVLNVLDLEGRLTGNEIRVGGFDLMWDDNPIYIPCIGSTECGPVAPAEQLLNLCLGCLNDRDKQLKQLTQWGKLMTK